jgi:hypothetical protein
LLIMANWVYSLELLTCAEFLRALAGQDSISCAPEHPDQFAHQPHELAGTIARLQSRLQRQAQE